MPTVGHEYAVLAPVPLQHLESGVAVAEKEGFVAFGTMKWEFLRKLDERRKEVSIPVLIYPSHEHVPAKDTFVVGWFGWYIGHKQGENGTRPEGMKHRPPTTGKYADDNKGHWAAFWHVQGLRQLPPEKQVPISKIQGIKGGWRKNAPPYGPELVTLPELLSYET